MNIVEVIQQQAAALNSEVVRHYRWLHRHPELSYRERETSAYITTFLDEEGITYRKEIGGYGILARVRGEQQEDDNCIAFVADMDALPLQEQNEVAYCSMNDGVMHACGHDAQSAALMGAVKIVHSLRTLFSGTALFIFQPGEEQSPGGASLMLNDDLFRDDDPAFIVKQHAYIDLPAGCVGFQSGTIMASADEIHIKVKGEGGHGALPHKLNDTVLAASQIVVVMQQLVSRRRDPFNPMVLSFGRLIANGATNVIPAEVTLAGSMRCMDELERQVMLQLIPQIAASTAHAYGCSCVTELPPGYPAVVSDERVTEQIRGYAMDYLYPRSVSLFPRRMTADDFGFYSLHYPCCYYRFGVAPADGKAGALHTSTFLIDEKALSAAYGLFAYIALKSLNKE